MTLILLYYIIVIIRGATLTFDQGYENSFDQTTNTDFLCYSSKSFTQTTTFAGTFARIPKLIITYSCYDLLKNFPAEFLFTIDSVTVSHFTIKVQCLANQLWTIRYNWTAIDDERIEVITISNYNLAIKESQIFTFPHSNPNALYGFTSLISFGYTGEFNIKLQIVQITRDSVSVKYTTDNTNLYQIGYQIILTTNIYKSSLLYSQLYSSQNYQSGILQKQQGQVLLTPISGLRFFNQENMRLRCNFTETAETISYFCEAWAQSKEDFYHEQVWLTLPITKIFIPMVHKKMIAKKIFNPIAQLNELMKLTILSRTYKVSSDSGNLLIDSNHEDVNLIVYFQCDYRQKIQGNVLHCPTCNRQFFSINDVCHPTINEVTYNITFSKQEDAIQQINIQVTTQGFIITQTIVNQVSQQYQLLQLEIHNS